MASPWASRGGLTPVTSSTRVTMMPWTAFEAEGFFSTDIAEAGLTVFA